MTSDTSTEALFSTEEARVLACLMEKELTVPDNYPLTLNSLTLACNQKSNREPQMQLPEGEVGHLAKTLAQREFVRIEYGERAHKFEHSVRKSLGINRQQQALLTVMMLRAPQTLNDLKARTKRMAEFDDTDQILAILESLNDDAAPLMLHMPKGIGQREDRYTHLLCGEIDITAAPAKHAFEPLMGDDKYAELEAKIDALSHRIEQLEVKMSQ